MSWWSALAICVVLTIVLAVVYVAVLWVVHTPELISAYHSILPVYTRLRPVRTLL